MQENKPILIVGLGNPGDKYAATRHNVGFMAIDNLAGLGAKWKSEKKALTMHLNISGQKVILVKPQTFMNNSGTAVRELMTFYKVPIDNLIVIHDDMDLPVGELREKVGGGSAGHNGIKSIDTNVGKEYLRFRIGVGHPRDNSPSLAKGCPAGGVVVNNESCKTSKMDPADWVLGKFTKSEMVLINKTIAEIKI